MERKNFWQYICRIITNEKLGEKTFVIFSKISNENNVFPVNSATFDCLTILKEKNISIDLEKNNIIFEDIKVTEAEYEKANTTFVEVGKNLEDFKGGIFPLIVDYKKYSKKENQFTDEHKHTQSKSVVFFEIIDSRGCWGYGTGFVMNHENRAGILAELNCFDCFYPLQREFGKNEFLEITGSYHIYFKKSSSGFFNENKSTEMITVYPQINYQKSRHCFDFVIRKKFFLEIKK